MSHEPSLQKNNDALDQVTLERDACSDFLSIMVHQLRTPLTANKWALGMMANSDFGEKSDEEKKILDRIIENNNQAIKLLAEVSQAHHVDAWTMQLDIQPANMNECIDHVVESFIPEAGSKNISITYNRNDDLPIIKVDKNRMCIALQNLVENAIKYNKHGGKVTIETKVHNDHVTIIIHDTGIGIPHDAQRKLFSKFFRAPNALHHSQGTGLGLYVVKQIVEAHHGSVWVESQESFGSMFFISLPLAK